MRPRTQTLLIGFLIILLICGHMIKPLTNYLMLPIGRILAFGGSAYVAVAVNPVIGLLVALVCLQAMSEFYMVEHLMMERAGEGTVMDEVARNFGYRDEAHLKTLMDAAAAHKDGAGVLAVITLTKSLVEKERTRKAGDAERLKERSLIVGSSNPACECPTGYTYTKDTNDCVDKDGKKTKPSMCACSAGYAYDVATGVCKQSSVMSSPIPVTSPAPEGTETPALESAPSAPASSSLRPMQIELSEADKREILGKEPLPAA